MKLNIYELEELDRALTTQYNKDYKEMGKGKYREEHLDFLDSLDNKIEDEIDRRKNEEKEYE